MPRLLLLATGDTLAQVRHGSPPRIADGAELLTRVTAPEGTEVEDVRAEPSWDTSPGTQLLLARRARSALLDDGYDGVVITHGLDTIEETAFLTDVLLGPAADLGAVVLTGATRCLDDPATDGPINLAAALTVAADPVTPGLGAVLCLDGELHAARRAHLADTTRSPSITSAPHPRLGHIAAGRVVLTDKAPPRPPVITDLPETNVALVKTYPGMPTSLLTAVTDAGALGVVVEGTGRGNVPVELLMPIRELLSWDIPVVVASRAHSTGFDVDGGREVAPSAGSGVLGMDAVDLAGRVGAISAGGLRPGQARVALMAALASGGGVAAARAYFAGL